MKKEKQTYQTPPNYFEEFQDRLQSQLALEEVLGDIKTGGFIVPENYFSTLSRKLSQIPAQQITEPKVIKLKPRYWSAVAIAASVLLLLGLWINNNSFTQSTSDIDDIAAYLDTESTTLYTEDILSLLSEEDLSSIVLTEDAQDEDIINYLETFSNPYDLELE